MPRVSVVIPVYNAEKYIGATLDTISAQGFADFDAHVVDDCSTDRSAEIVRRHCEKDPRFHYHRSPQNFGGPAGPRNIGVAAGDSAFVAFCDADDLWVPHKLETQIAIAETTGADIISAVVRDFQDGTTPAPIPAPSGAIPVTTIRHRRLLLKNWIALSSVMARRETLDRAGPFNEARDHVAVEDYDMWLRTTADGAKVCRIGVPLVHYRKLATQISANKSMMVHKALNMIGDDYRRRDLGTLFTVTRPLHWMLYIGTSAWMRAVRREL